MSDDKPVDDVLQQQLEYFAKMIRKATNSNAIIIVSVCGEEGHSIQAAIHMPKPDHREHAVLLKSQAWRAFIIAAATVLEKGTGGEFQLMIKMPDGKLHPALSDEIERVMSEKYSP